MPFLAKSDRRQVTVFVLAGLIVAVLAPLTIAAVQMVRARVAGAVG